MDSSNIVDVNEGDFENIVINASENKLVIVDFWAPWCGPCKQLTPIMEKVAKENPDNFDLVKINIDDNQQIAAQLRIQSIPAVFAFFQGKPLDGFMGAQTENQIKEFISNVIKKSGVEVESDLDTILENANTSLETVSYTHLRAHET